MKTKTSRFSVARVNVQLALSESPHEFWLVDGFNYRTDILREHLLYVYPFNTDLASIPWYIQWYLKKRGKWDLPAILHDYMLEHRDEFLLFSRKDIDRVFREACIDQGVSEAECTALYAGVRVNSWWREERFG